MPQKKHNYQIEFPKGQEIQNYIKVKITNLKEKDNKNKIIYISPDNQDAKKNRIQLIQTGVENSVDIWIKKEELNDSNLYATVDCQIGEDEKFDYLIQFIGYKYVVIESIAFNEKNKEMIFSIKNDLTTKIKMEKFKFSLKSSIKKLFRLVKINKNEESKLKNKNLKFLGLANEANFSKCYQYRI